MSDIQLPPQVPAPTIHKYEFDFEIGEVFELELRRDAHLLHVDHQPSTNKHAIWAAVDTNLPMIKRKFFVVGTGQPLPVDRAIAPVGTWLVGDGSLVWHLWEDHTEAMLAEQARVEQMQLRAQIMGAMDGPTSPGTAPRRLA